MLNACKRDVVISILQNRIRIGAQIGIGGGKLALRLRTIGARHRRTAARQAASSAGLSCPLLPLRSPVEAGVVRGETGAGEEEMRSRRGGGGGGGGGEEETYRV